LAYDEELKIFVTDIEIHEAYKRGKAVDRQDRTGGAGGILTHNVVEESEEIRNLTCIVLNTLLRRTIELNASSVLHPYFHEIIMYLQMQLRDPFPDLKAQACISIGMYIYTYMSVFLNLWLYSYIHIHVYIKINVDKHIDKNLLICIHIYRSAVIYIYIYVYI
jgi:hypothetical protein